MNKKQLGSSSLMVSALAFGGNVFGWTINEKTSFEILDELLANGFNFIDTADVYCRWATNEGGESETIIGNWMKKKKNRNLIVLATKVGMDMGDGKMGLSKKYILRAVDASLKRLQTDHIDLYQSHRDDEKTPIEETLEAYSELIKAGKVRYIGASNYSAQRLLESLDISKKYSLPRYESLQPHYNLYERNIFEGELQKVCIENKIGVISYYSLAAGFLTGKYRSENDLTKSARGRSMSKFMNKRGMNILTALDEISASHKCKPAAVALAWLMQQAAITAPIASATSITQLHEITKAAELRLTEKEILFLNEASSL